MMNLNWTPLPVAECMKKPAPDLDFVIPGLVAGTVGSLVAPGATGKSWLALQIAAAVAGADTIDIRPSATGNVVYLAAEDPGTVLHQRLRVLAAAICEDQREEVAERLTLIPALGQVGDLLDDGATAAAIGELSRNARLVIIDTLSRWHTGEENSREDAARVMRILERTCSETGAAILFLHHANKSAVLEGNGATQQAARGSSVFVDDARFVMTMTSCSEQDARDYGIDEDMRGFFVKTSYAKCNYLPPQPARWFRKRAGGILEPVEMQKIQRVVKKKARVTDDDDF